MAIRRIDRSRLDEAKAADLRKGLTAELQRPENTPAPPAAPVIYMEESGTPDNYTHWYAVWDRFEGVDNEERSRLLLETIREVQGPTEALRVTIAMGLTPAEAEGFGLPLDD